ncbi:tRNA (cytidine(34)-2'-O)-methyltransferase [Pirellulaceae bacterium]|jgi:tRNA (cytidine/uridine-2'-O-)-methyltransferase|nr:tRNA (cytidine(34)-2'-O)-methyltransferase [Pirellulaceae bacterium]
MKCPINVVLFEPEIPQNTGNIGRTCVAVGAKLWLVEPLGFELTEKRLRRAGLDYWQHLDLEIVDDWEQLLQRLPNLSPWVFTKHASQCYVDATYGIGDTLIFGNESSGLPAHIHDSWNERCVRVPMRDEVRSLNLATTAGIAIYEAHRQISELTD